MIVKQTRTKAISVASTAAHVLRGAANESIIGLIGDVDEIAAKSLARSSLSKSKSTAVMRQVIFSPTKPLTAAQEKRMLAMWAKEFKAHGFEMAAVKHVKKRANSNKAPHYHILVPEIGPKGIRLDDKFFKVRNEKLARMCELEFGHELTKGHHNDAVYHQFVKEGRLDFAEAMKPLLEDAPAMSRYSSTGHQIAARNGVDLAEIAFKLQPVAGADAAFNAERIAKLTTEYPISVSITDKGHLCLFSEDGTRLVSLNRMGRFSTKQNAEILEKINLLTNAAETQLADTSSISNKETEDDGRQTTLGARYDAGATTATIGAPGTPGAEPRAEAIADLERDQGRHDVDLGEIGPSAEPEPRPAERATRNSGTDSQASRSNDRDARSIGEPKQSAGRSPRGQQIPSAAHEDFPRNGRAADRALTSVSALQTAQLQAVWMPKRGALKAGAEKLGKPISMLDTAPIAKVWPKPKPTISKLQVAQLQSSWNQRREQLLSGNKRLGKPIGMVDATPIAKVWPKPKPTLSRLDEAILDVAWSSKGNKLKEGASKLEKPISAVDAAPITKVYPTAAALAERLPMPAIRKLFAQVKGLSGNDREAAIAKLLAKHGLHLDVGAKSGVITINRKLPNGSVEFLGSLDRFAGIKTSDAERGAVIAGIMKQVSAQDVRPDQPKPQHKEALTNGTVEQQKAKPRRLDGDGKSGREVWQQYVAGIEERTGKLETIKRIASDGYAPHRGREDGLDSDCAAPDKRPIDRDAASESRRREPRSADAKSVRSDHIEDHQHRETGDRSSRNDDRPHQKQQLGAGRARNDIQAKSQDTRSLEVTVAALKSGIATAVSKTQFNAQAELRVDGWLMMTSKSTVDAMPAVNKAPVGKSPSRTPSMEGTGARMQPTLDMGGDHVTADFGGDELDDEAKKKKAQENSKRIAASLGPKM